MEGDEVIMNLTWNELLTRLQGMSAAELCQNATVCIDDEFYPLKPELGKSKDGDPADGVLDHGHWYLEVV